MLITNLALPRTSAVASAVECPPPPPPRALLTPKQVCRTAAGAATARSAPDKPRRATPRVALASCRCYSVKSRLVRRLHTFSDSIFEEL